MNKINPLYLLGAFVFAAVIIIYKTVSLETKIQNLRSANTHAKSYAKEIASLKEGWKERSKMLSRINKLLSHSAYAKSVTKKERRKNIFYIETKPLEKRALDTFVNKFLNERIAIKKLTIERKNANSASIKLECAL